MSEVPLAKLAVFYSRYLGEDYEGVTDENLVRNRNVALALRELQSLRQQLREAGLLADSLDHTDACATYTREVDELGLGCYPHECDCGLDNIRALLNTTGEK